MQIGAEKVRETDHSIEFLDLREYISDIHERLSDANADTLLVIHKSMKGLYDTAAIELAVTAFDAARETMLRDNPELAVAMVERYLADSEDMHMDAYWALLDLWKHDEYKEFALENTLGLLYHPSPDIAAKALDVVKTHLQDGDIFPEDAAGVLREAVARITRFAE